MGSKWIISVANNSYNCCRVVFVVTSSVNKSDGADGFGAKKVCANPMATESIFCFVVASILASSMHVAVFVACADA